MFAVYCAQTEPAKWDCCCCCLTPIKIDEAETNGTPLNRELVAGQGYYERHEYNTSCQIVSYRFGRLQIDGDAPEEEIYTKGRDKDVVIFVSRRRKSPVFPQNR